MNCWKWCCENRRVIPLISLLRKTFHLIEPLDGVVCWAQRCDKTIFLSSDYKIELATRQTRRNNWTVCQLASSQRAVVIHGQAVISCSSTAWVPLAIATESHNMLECIRNMRMPCDCIDAAMPVDVTLSASQACSLMMRNVIHCRVRPLQQWHASRASGGWSRPTPRRLLMNTTACTVLSRHSCELFPQVVIGPWRCIFPSKKPLHTDRLSHCFNFEHTWIVRRECSSIFLVVNSICVRLNLNGAVNCEQDFWSASARLTWSSRHVFDTFLFFALEI